MTGMVTNPLGRVDAGVCSLRGERARPWEREGANGIGAGDLYGRGGSL